MKIFNGIFGGILFSVSTSLLVIGALSLSLTESRSAAAPAALLQGTPTTAATATPSASPTSAFSPTPSTATPLPSPTATITASPTALLSATPTATLPVSCPIPYGWAPYLVQSGDTLQIVAQKFGVAPSLISLGNCLMSTTLLPGTVLYLPSTAASPTPLPAPTYPACGAPYGWIRYTVQPYDTLFRLSQEVGVSIYDLQRANCLGGSTYIRAGQLLWLPFYPIRTPIPQPTYEYPTATAWPTLEITPTPEGYETPTPEFPTEIPTLGGYETPTTDPNGGQPYQATPDWWPQDPTIPEQP